MVVKVPEAVTAVRLPLILRIAVESVLPCTSIEAVVTTVWLAGVTTSRNSPCLTLNVAVNPSMITSYVPTVSSERVNIVSPSVPAARVTSFVSTTEPSILRATSWVPGPLPSFVTTTDINICSPGPGSFGVIARLDTENNGGSGVAVGVGVGFAVGTGVAVAIGLGFEVAFSFTSVSGLVVGLSVGLSVGLVVGLVDASLGFSVAVGLAVSVGSPEISICGWDGIGVLVGGGLVISTAGSAAEPPQAITINKPHIKTAKLAPK